NNHLKSPFMTGIQIIYKMFVQPFGQVWLTPVVLSFVVVMYTWCKENLHGVLAGFLTVLLVATPESFAYTFMALFDYSNMVLMTFGTYFLWKYLREQELRFLWVSSLYLGMATYLRTESLVLIVF